MRRSLAKFLLCTVLLIYGRWMQWVPTISAKKKRKGRDIDFFFFLILAFILFLGFLFIHCEWWFAYQLKLLNLIFWLRMGASCCIVFFYVMLFNCWWQFKWHLQNGAAFHYFFFMGWLVGWCGEFVRILYVCCVYLGMLYFSKERKQINNFFCWFLC